MPAHWNTKKTFQLAKFCWMAAITDSRGVIGQEDTPFHSTFQTIQDLHHCESGNRGWVHFILLKIPDSVCESWKCHRHHLVGAQTAAAACRGAAEGAQESIRGC